MGAGSEAEHPVSESIRSQFAPHRLRMARELAGLSQGKLGEVVGVTAAAVSQYERGAAVPTAGAIGSLAQHLAVPEKFFAGGESGADTPAFFRSLRAAPAVDRKRARHLTQLVHEVAQSLETDVRLPVVNVPRIAITPDAGSQNAWAAARAVREHWAVPRGPIENMVRLVERHGVVVARPQSGHDQIDAFSVPFGDRPVIIMSPSKGKRDRSRFDVAHELGHLVMHDPSQATTKQVERQAHAFAAEILMPEADIRDQLPRTVDWDRLLDLKRIWQVSLQALLFRARDLELLSQDDYVRARKALSARGWRRHEPGNLGPPEHPVMLSKAIELAALTEEQLAQRSAIPLPLLRDVLDSAADGRPEVLI